MFLLLSPWTLVGLVCLFFGALSILAIVYRLLLHPLANFPGPFLAALTDYYAAYYDIWMAGGQVKQLEKLHKIYGPVVRIRPNQLHFCDVEAFESIYGSSFATTKFSPFYDCFHDRESSFGFIDPDSARERRDILSPFFSRQNILELENVVQHSVDRLISALNTYAGLEPRPANLYLALTSTTMEIVTSLCLTSPLNALDYLDFRHPALITFLSSAGVYFFLQHFSFVIPLAFHLPEWVQSSEMLAVGQLFKDIEKRVDHFLANPSSLNQSKHRTIFHALIGQKSGRRIPSKRSILDEASAMTATGSDAVANACSVGIFHVLSNPIIRTRLTKELKEAWPKRDVHIGFETLEKLPYLTAVIKESLRLSHGFVSPLPRVLREDVFIAKRFVQAGTVIAMGHSFVHHNPDIFPNPLLFDPNRWLEDELMILDKYLVAFSKGPRMCLGINLAWCELYLIFGNLFHKLDMEIYETTVHDFDFKAYLTPVYTGQLHVLVKP
ncbi:hypothetical protein D9756_008526 [Leucocoprinus leucothites]|uniref:Cytochrome P450 n=1 Tax=Leucocoprinus leucothites TaxID=201217 RepID=A0A8H5D1Y1_9AGAR|nr:hypothetical protein D9756_008526 [Leucoagaricus leucothites]